MDENRNTIPPVDGEGVVTADDVLSALVEAEQSATSQVDSASSSADVADSTEPNVVDEVASKRTDHIRQFQLDLDLGDIPDAAGMSVGEDENVSTAEPNTPVQIDEEDEATEQYDEEDESTKSGSGCIGKMIVALIIVAISCVLATGICIFVFGATGWTGSNEDKEVIIPEGANTKQIAEILKKEDLINDELCFRIFSRISGADGKWQVGAFTLQGDMGFSTIIETLQVSTPRETVTVMLREGLTIDEMAVILEQNDVCTKQAFLDAVMYGKYDYDFVDQIPTEEDDPAYAYRVYRLEGYLFPDTYQFYVGSLGETVVDKMLSNFQSKLTSSLLDKIEEQGWTIDDAVIFASMVQGEGDTRENMDKVSRVLHNRLASSQTSYKKLELCSTRDYANEMAENDHFESDVLHQAYNTYKREGFPIGAIGNPGLDALLAAVSPSEDETIMKCYFFATDYKTGITYFSKTYKEHQAIIKKYGITDLG